MPIIETPGIYASNKILSINEARRKVSRIKSQNKTAGLCHGGFDLLHSGHIRHFESAKKICDCLFVSVTSDKFVSLLKGQARPVFSEKLRAYSVANSQFVDYVVISDFKLGVEIINILKPSYYIKGQDYINKQNPDIDAERDAISIVGGEIRFTTEPKLSTSEIIRYIKEKL
ncbi:MAG: adenylyltransferase/cytidyltransferase family protein [Nanoarchaeota archaeon]